MIFDYKLRDYLEYLSKPFDGEFIPKATLYSNDLEIVVLGFLRLLHFPSDEEIAVIAEDLYGKTKEYVSSYLSHIKNRILDCPDLIFDSYFFYGHGDVGFFIEEILSSSNGFEYVFGEPLVIKDEKKLSAFIKKRVLETGEFFHDSYSYEKFLFISCFDCYHRWVDENRAVLFSYFEKKYSLNRIQIKVVSNLFRLYEMVLDYYRDSEINSSEIIEQYRLLLSCQYDISIMNNIPRKGGLGKGGAYKETNELILEIYKNEYQLKKVEGKSNNWINLKIQEQIVAIANKNSIIKKVGVSKINTVIKNKYNNY